ncbi:MAG: hypothetical protein QM773_00670 [Hyphomonadaceae bacterium]
MKRAEIWIATAGLIVTIVGVGITAVQYWMPLQSPPAAQVSTIAPIRPSPDPAAPANGAATSETPVLDQFFDGGPIHKHIAYLEHLVGPAPRGNGYIVDGCNVTVEDQGGVITSVTLEVTERCTVDWKDVSQNLGELPPANDLKFGDVSGFLWIECPESVECGNRFIPHIEVLTGGSNADDNLYFIFGHKGSVDGARDCKSISETRINYVTIRTVKGKIEGGSIEMSDGSEYGEYCVAT